LDVTPDDLASAVLGDDVDRVLGLLAGSSESERRASARETVRLRKAHGDWPFLARDPKLNETTLLALLGTGSAAQIEAGRRMWRHNRAGEVLRLRPQELLVE